MNDVTIQRVVLLVGVLGLVSYSSAYLHRPVEHRRPTPSAAAGRDSADGRLPLDLIPVHYDLDIVPDFYDNEPPFEFLGTVAITFDCVTATSVLTVNSVRMDITDVGLSVSANSPISAADPVLTGFSLEPAADFLHINVESPFEVGAQYMVAITFNGTVNSNNYQSGLYWDSYVLKQDESTAYYVLATQLEALGGREMFPCFDEPDLKATFTVTVAYRSSVIALSNMPVVGIIDRGDGWLANIHSVSPIMSTYQVCICVGDFDYVELSTDGILNYPVRIYARPSLIDQMVWVANASIYIQAWLESETGIQYHLPKMDHIALPTKGGAMENWGLVTYGEQYFAVNPETSAASGIQMVGSITSHELAHQWYGNLVTCAWWSDIWLNEGYATYYDFMPTLSLGWTGTEPSQLDTQYFMDSDQKNTSDPVIKSIDTVWMADLSFSGSTYPKGGAMVRFLRGIVGQSTFNVGMTRYLQQFEYDATVSDDLFQVLTDQAADDGYDIDVKAVMDPWLRQMGFPVILFVHNLDGTATISQSRFLHPPNQDINVDSEWNYRWTIPLTVVNASSSSQDWDARPTNWLDIDANELVLTGLSTNMEDWVIINPKFRFYYRVMYDDISFAALVIQLVNDHTVIEHHTRSQLIDDTFTLARASYVPETNAMELTRYLGNEFSYNPWYATFKYTSLSNAMLSDFSWHWTFTTYMLSLITPVYESLGWTYPAGEDIDQQLFRRDIISAACDYGLDECLQQAQSEYDTYIVNPDVNSVNPNNLPTVLCTGVASGSSDDWLMSYEQYQARKLSQVREERYAYLIGATCTTDVGLLDLYLTYLVRGEIPARDMYRATLYLSQNPTGADILWNYFDNSWDVVPSRMSKFTILKYITQTWATEEQLASLTGLIEKYPPSTESQWNLFNQMTLTVQQNIVWLGDNQDSLMEWLETETGPLRLRSHPKIGRRLPVSIGTHWRSLNEPDDDLQPLR
jgi:aminopeptidase N